MPFADELIGVETVDTLIGAIRAVAPRADLAGLASVSLAPLTVRERSDVLRDALLADLPGDYHTFAATIRAARDGAASFAGWLIWPVSCAVARKAIEDGTDAAFDDAMALLADLTPLLTSEFALRDMLRHNPERALAISRSWSAAEHEHVRRLASEGTRPYLPWAQQIPALLATPRATLPILDALYRDNSEYVRRSVANHLNDLSRKHPDLVVATARGWLAAPDSNTESLVRHALRTLIKKGDPGALELMGFAHATLDVHGPELDRTTIAFGATIAFGVTITNTATEPARLSIDYTVHHQKSNGTQTGKTFKLAVRDLAPGEQITLRREHSFRPITTRRYYPGPHAIELHINGSSSGRAEFTLLPPRA